MANERQPKTGRITGSKWWRLQTIQLRQGGKPLKTVTIAILLAILLSLGLLSVSNNQAQAEGLSPTLPTSSCYGEECNGQSPYGTGCYRLAYPVRQMDITFYGQVIMNVSIRYAPDCNAFYGQMDSFRVKRTMQVTIFRVDNHLYGSGGYRNEFTVQSLMVGKKYVKDEQVMETRVDGCYLDSNRNYHCWRLKVP